MAFALGVFETGCRWVGRAPRPFVDAALADWNFLGVRLLLIKELAVIKLFLQRVRYQFGTWCVKTRQRFPCRQASMCRSSEGAFTKRAASDNVECARRKRAGPCPVRCGEVRSGAAVLHSRVPTIIASVYEMTCVCARNLASGQCGWCTLAIFSTSADAR